MQYIYFRSMHEILLSDIIYKVKQSQPGQLFDGRPFLTHLDSSVRGEHVPQFSYGKRMCYIRFQPTPIQLEKMFLRGCRSCWVTKTIPIKEQVCLAPGLNLQIHKIELIKLLSFQINNFYQSSESKCLQYSKKHYLKKS